MKWHIFFLSIIFSVIILLTISINNLSILNRTVINDIFNLEIELRELNTEYHQLISERDNLIEHNLSKVIKDLDLRVVNSKDKVFLYE